MRMNSDHDHPGTLRRCEQPIFGGPRRVHELADELEGQETSVSRRKFMRLVGSVRVWRELGGRRPSWC